MHNPLSFVLKPIQSSQFSLVAQTHYNDDDEDDDDDADEQQSICSPFAHTCIANLHAGWLKGGNEKGHTASLLFSRQLWFFINFKTNLAAAKGHTAQKIDEMR